ncbi:MAG: 30S ribosomal protein S9, partial [Nitrospirae bacterium]
MMTPRHYATGKRKYAIARAYLEPGPGESTVNGKPLYEYFTLLAHRVQVESPFQVTNTLGQFRVRATVCGGGISGQAGALRHAIARALVQANPEYRIPLEKEGLL